MQGQANPATIYKKKINYAHTAIEASAAVAEERKMDENNIANAIQIPP